MGRIEATDVVPHPREQVFAAAADPEQQLKWDPDTLKSVKKLSSGPLGRGSRYRGTFKGFGTVDYEFAEFDEPNRFAHLANVRVGRMRHTFTFDEVPEGTRVIQVGELKPNLMGPPDGPDVQEDADQAIPSDRSRTRRLPQQGRLLHHPVVVKQGGIRLAETLA